MSPLHEVVGFDDLLQSHVFMLHDSLNTASRHESGSAPADDQTDVFDESVLSTVASVISDPTSVGHSTSPVIKSQQPLSVATVPIQTKASPPAPLASTSLTDPISLLTQATPTSAQVRHSLSADSTANLAPTSGAPTGHLTTALSGITASSSQDGVINEALRHRPGTAPRPIAENLVASLASDADQPRQDTVFSQQTDGGHDTEAGRDLSADVQFRHHNLEYEFQPSEPLQATGVLRSLATLNTDVPPTLKHRTSSHEASVTSDAPVLMAESALHGGSLTTRVSRAGYSNDAPPIDFGWQLGKVVSSYAVTMASGEVTSVEAELQPPELGRVRIRLTKTDSGLQAVIVAEDPAVQHLITTHSSRIEQMLNVDLPPTDFLQLNVSDQTAGDGFFSHQDDPDRKPVPENRLRLAAAEETIESEEQQPHSGLDLLA